MSLPFLAGVFAMTMSVGWASLNRTGSAIEARHHVWKLRPNPDQSSPVVRKQLKGTSPLGVQDALTPTAGEIYGEIDTDVKLYSGFGNVTTKGRAAVVANTWDHKAIGNDFDGEGPHIQIFKRMAIALGLSAITGLAELPEMNLSNQDEIDAAQGEIDKAKEEQEKQEEAYKEQIEELEAEYDKAKAERDVLVGEKAQLEADRDQVDEDIKALEEQIAEQDPVDPALQQQLEDKREERDDLTDDIADKQLEINAKEEEMRRIRREINKHEDAMQDSKGDLEDLPSGT